MSNTPKNYTKPQGYSRGDGRYADVEPIVLLPQQTLAAGCTIGPVFEVGDREIFRGLLVVTAKSGTSPTLDVTIQSSHDGENDWSTVGSAFAQKSDVGLTMTAVTATGTTPPTITLSGTQLQPVDLRIECTTLGARGTAVIRYSIDGGVSWVANVTTAATISVIDPLGNDTGLVINYASATAATDNVWTAKTAGYERKRFAGLGRFLRAVANVGGSSNPTLDASVTGDLV